VYFDLCCLKRPFDDLSQKLAVAKRNVKSLLVKVVDPLTLAREILA